MGLIRGPAFPLVRETSWIWILPRAALHNVCRVGFDHVLEWHQQSTDPCCRSSESLHARKMKRVGLLYVRGKPTNLPTAANRGLSDLPQTEWRLKRSLILARVFIYTLLSLNVKSKWGEISPSFALSNEFCGKALLRTWYMWICLWDPKMCTTQEMNRL